MLNLPGTSVSFTIVPEIPTDYISKFYEFWSRIFLPSQKNRFADISTGNFSVNYSVLDFTGNRIISVRASGSESITAVIEPLTQTVSEDDVLKSKEDVEIAVDAFEDHCNDSKNIMQAFLR